jgi:uncharacterized cupin superfamily protein
VAHRAGGPAHLADAVGFVGVVSVGRVVFPVGPDGAHGVRNETSSPCRVMMFSEVRTPAVTVYPDSDKIGAFTGNDDTALFVRSSKVEYFEGEA